MGQRLAALERFLAKPHRVNKAAFLVEIPGLALQYQLVGIAALPSGRLGQLGFLLRCEMYFHEAQSKRKKPRIARLHDG